MIQAAYDKWKTCVQPRCEHDVFRSEIELKQCLFCNKHLTKEGKRKSEQIIKNSEWTGWR